MVLHFYFPSSRTGTYGKDLILIAICTCNSIIFDTMFSHILNGFGFGANASGLQLALSFSVKKVVDNSSRCSHWNLSIKYRHD